jgi:hypothetical protein
MKAGRERAAVARCATIPLWRIGPTTRAAPGTSAIAQARPAHALRLPGLPFSLATTNGTGGFGMEASARNYTGRMRPLWFRRNVLAFTHGCRGVRAKNHEMRLFQRQCRRARGTQKFCFSK